MLLQLINVSKRYASPVDGESLEILRDVNLEIAAGESVSVVGPSGSGKSTLLNIIGSLDQPTAGEVLFDGRDVQKLTAKQLAALRNRQIGFIFQLHHLLPQCTILENVLIPTLTAPKELQTAETIQRAGRLLERVGLEKRQGHRPGQLSGGERQRVAVVRALINRPKLVLADEPTGSLDRVSAQHLGELLIELNKEEDVTLVIATHWTELAQRAGRRFELRAGKLLAL